MSDNGLSELEITKTLARQMLDRTEASIRTKIHDTLHPHRRFKRNVQTKKIPDMISGHEYNIMCPQYWQPIGLGGTQEGAVKRLKFIEVVRGTHTAHYIFEHPQGGWKTSIREQELTKVLVTEGGV